MKTKNDNDRKRVKTNELAEQRNAEGESGKRMDHALGNGGKPSLSGKKAAGTGQPARAEKPVRSGNLACKAKRVSRRNEGVERKVCRCCGKNLPLEDFYVRGASLRPDSYCKACRRAAALRQREQRYMLRLEQTIRHTTPLITEEADATLRMGMILHARGVVFASKQRKRAKEAEAEDLRVNHEIDKEEEQSSRSEALRTETSRTGTLPSETSCFETPGSEALHAETSCPEASSSGALCSKTRNPEALCKLPSETKTSTLNPLTDEESWHE